MRFLSSKEFRRLMVQLERCIDLNQYTRFKKLFTKNRFKLSEKQAREIATTFMLYEPGEWVRENYFPWPDNSIPKEWKEWCWKHKIHEQFVVNVFKKYGAEYGVDVVKHVCDLHNSRSRRSEYHMTVDQIFRVYDEFPEYVMNNSDTKYIFIFYEYILHRDQFSDAGMTFMDFNSFVQANEYVSSLFHYCISNGKHWSDYLEVIRYAVKNKNYCFNKMALRVYDVIGDIEHTLEIVDFACHFEYAKFDLFINEDLLIFATRHLRAAMHAILVENLVVKYNWPKKTAKRVINAVFDIMQRRDMSYLSQTLFCQIFAEYFGVNIFSKYEEYFTNWNAVDKSFEVVSWLKHVAERSNYLFKPRHFQINGQEYTVYWASRIDEIRACDVDRVNESADSVLKKMQDRIRREKIKEYEKKNYKVAQSPLGDAPELGIRFLPDAKSIGLEGNFMDHCVWGYAPKAKAGRCYIYHVGPEAPDGVTAEVNVEGNIIYVPQIYGYRDSAPNRKFVKTFMSWIYKKAKQLGKRVDSSYTV